MGAPLRVVKAGVLLTELSAGFVSVAGGQAARSLSQVSYNYNTQDCAAQAGGYTAACASFGTASLCT